MKMNRIAAVALAGLGLLGAASSAHAIVYTGTSGARSASVEFVKSGNKLVVTLTNTATSDAGAPTDILTGVFFDLAGLPSLSRTSAIVPNTSTVFGDPNAAHNGTGPIDVGGEWAFKSGLAGAPSSAKYGISSSGLNLFGPTDRFGTTNLQGPDSPDGVQYGITTASDNTATGNGGITGVGLIKNQVVFTLSGLTGGFDVNTAISNITFQYGTALNEPHFGTTTGGTTGGTTTGGTTTGGTTTGGTTTGGTTTGGTTGGGGPPSDGVPEPATASLGLLGLAALAAGTRRR